MQRIKHRDKQIIFTLIIISVIDANAVVLQDVPQNSITVGVLTKIKSRS